MQRLNIDEMSMKMINCIFVLESCILYFSFLFYLFHFIFLIKEIPSFFYLWIVQFFQTGNRCLGAGINFDVHL